MAARRLPLRVERRRARPLLGTRVVLRARGEAGADEEGTERARLDCALDAAFATVARVQALLSYHDAGSELSRLNRAAYAAPIAVTDWTYRVLAAARAFAEESQGAFDPTVAARLERDGLLPAVPDAPPPDPAARWQELELLPDRRVRFRRPLRLDLGGIAKGFAIDRAVDTLRALGVTEGLVEAGGDLRAFGQRAFRVGLRHPETGGASGWRMNLRNQALAGSAGGFAETLDGRLTSALLAPLGREGSGGPDGDNAGHVPKTSSNPPPAARLGVVVRAPDAMTADALTKVVLFAPPALAEAVLARHGAAAVRLVVERGAGGRGP